MASLRSMILDGRSILAVDKQDNLSPKLDQEVHQLIEKDQQALRSKDTILINTQNVYKSIEALGHEAKIDLGLVPQPVPPFHSIWLEATAFTPPIRLGVMIRRYPIPADFDLDKFLSQGGNMFVDKEAPCHLIYGNAWREQNGYIIFTGRFVYWLDSHGKLQDWRFFGKTLDLHLALTFHTFARLNCHNVKLVPRADSTAPHKNGKPPIPYSYWHEIVVTDLAELRKEKNENAPAGEKRELRFHKVRGHFADYTGGKGLFGKYKVRLWIEEHSRGNEELGTVVASYKIQ